MERSHQLHGSFAGGRTASSFSGRLDYPILSSLVCARDGHKLSRGRRLTIISKRLEAKLLVRLASNV